MRYLSVLCFFVFLAIFSACQQQQKQAPLNFLVILCDDLGYGDLAAYGHPHIKTPHLDRLAAEGMKFTACYAAAPVCSPSRAGLLTGRVPSRSGIYDWIPEDNIMHLREDETTLAEVLQEAGYSTCLVGKWHLNGKFNSPEQPQPDDHGFGYWMATQNNAFPTHENPVNFVRNGEAAGALQGYSCQVVATEAIRWLGEVREKEKPFFQLITFHEPHEPIASPAALVATYAREDSLGRATYYANVTNMDLAVGRLLQALDSLQLSASTLVFFTSDNGPETLLRYPKAQFSYGSPGPLRGMKLHLYEGGIRVPGILRWPGVVPPGSVSDEAISSLDLLPTFCELAGVSLAQHPKPLDGTSLAAMWQKGAKVKRKKPLFWHYYKALGEPEIAMLEGKTKITGWQQPGSSPQGNFQEADMAYITSYQPDTFERFQLEKDPGEIHALPVTKTLQQQLLQYHEEVQQEGVDWRQIK